MHSCEKSYDKERAVSGAGLRLRDCDQCRQLRDEHGQQHDRERGAYVRNDAALSAGAGRITGLAERAAYLRDTIAKIRK